ncbi:putative ribonuclease H-like domain-containing protein [Tanacetum coccineum]|uniref:Ribonuclease H-like domain-containing protein n=1 Tax=Tanacetum coccineum TaxID=301880 RepID=A0ABQ5FUN0_9ASTR
MFEALMKLNKVDWSMEFDAEHVHFGQDGLGDFDWSNKLMMHQSLEVMLKTHEKNEYAWGDKYEQMEYDLKIRDLKLEEKQKELDQALKERDDFKVKLEKWSNASVLQNEVLNKQRYVSDKSCIGFGIESSNSMESDISSGDETLTDSTYENFKREKAYKAVPPPTGTIIPPRANVSFTGIDELAIRNKVVNQEKTNTSQSAIDRNKVIIEDWVDSDDEETDVSESQKETIFNTKHSEESFQNRSPNSQNSVGQESRTKGLGNKGGKLCFVCYSPNHLIKDCNLHERTFQHTQTHKSKEQGSRETRPVWNNIQRVNHSNFARNSRYPHQRKSFIPSAVLTRDGLISTARPKMTQTVPSKSTANVTYQGTARSRVPTGQYFQDSTDGRQSRRGSQGTMLSLTVDVWEFKFVDEVMAKRMKCPMETEDWECSTSKISTSWASCKKIEERTVREPLELLHMDLFGPVSVESVNRKKYCLVVTDDCSKFSWVFFLAYKDETYDMLHDLIVGLENRLRHKVKTIRCDHGTEFKNQLMNEFCAKKGIKREYSIARTPQQNGVAERKNRTLIEAVEFYVSLMASKKKRRIFVGIILTTAKGLESITRVTRKIWLDQPIHYFTVQPRPSRGKVYAAKELNYPLKIMLYIMSLCSDADTPTDGVFSTNHLMLRMRKEPKKVSQKALAVECLGEAMQEELLQFKATRVDGCQKCILIWQHHREVYVKQPPGFEDPGIQTSMVYRRGAMIKLLFIKKDLEEISVGSGLQVKQSNGGIFLSQDKYVKDILNKFDFRTIKPASTPIEAHKSLGKDEEGEDVDVHLYRSMIGCLMYLTASRPDIMFAVCLCARFQVTPKVSHLHAVKRIFRYLKHQPNLGLWYPKDSPFHLEAFSDSDYAGDNHDRRSTSGGCQYLGRRLVSWQCKKQTIVAISSTEAEYVAAASCCAQVLWMQNQLLDYGFIYHEHMTSYRHMRAPFALVENPVFHAKPSIFRFDLFIRDCFGARLINVVKSSY